MLRVHVLGISEIDNDSGAALFVDDRLIGAVNEERYSRVKRHPGFPHAAVKWLLAEAGLKARELDAVVIVKPTREQEKRQNYAPLGEYPWFAGEAPISRKALNWLAFYGYKIPRNRYEIARYSKAIASWLEIEGVNPERVVRAHHHRSHAASAYFASGCGAALAVTMDGQGGGVSARGWKCSI